MRALLGILLCVILLQSQVFALKGGPDYNRDRPGVSATIVGTYGGVMIETAHNKYDAEEGVAGAELPASGSLAIYSVEIPSEGLAAGDVLIFTKGNVYPGTLTGVGDANEDSAFKGIIEASFDVINTFENGNGEFEEVRSTIVSNGTMDTAIEDSGAMRGTAELLVGGFTRPNEQVIYDVSGHRQSSVP